MLGKLAPTTFLRFSNNTHNIPKRYIMVINITQHRMNFEIVQIFEFFYELM